jgi:hypothetical protein
MVPFPRARLIASTHSSVSARVSAATRRLPKSAVAVQRYGRAALNELAFTAGLVAVALIALAGSGCPLRGDRLSSGRVGLPISR